MAKKDNGLDLFSEVAEPREKSLDHQKRVERYSKAKKRARLVSDHILKHYPKIVKTGNKVQDCGDYLLFRNYYLSDQYRLTRTNFCKKDKYCALCAIRRAAKVLRAYAEKIILVMSQNPEYELAFVTLTVRNGPMLMERFNHLKSNYKKLIQRRRNFKIGKVANTSFAHFAGGVATYEFTNKGKGWHPHIHMLAMVPKDYDYKVAKKELKAEWEELTNDSHQCDIKPVRMDSKENFYKSACEVFKYALKFNDLSLDDQIHAGQVLHRKMLVAPFDKFRGVQVPGDIEDTIEDELKLQPYIEMLYRYQNSYKLVKLEKIEDPWRREYEKELKDMAKEIKISKSRVNARNRLNEVYRKWYKEESHLWETLILP